MRLSGRIIAPSALYRILTTALIFGLALLCVACGETFRPVAQPLEGVQPNPEAAHSIIAINSDGVTDNHRGNGSASNIDASGDNVQGNVIAGIAPAHAALTPNGIRLYVANSGEDSVTVNTTSSPTVVAATISLPPSPTTQITAVTGNGTTATYTYAGAAGTFSAGDTVFVTGCATAGFNGVFTVTAASGNTFSVSNLSSATDNPEFGGARAKTPNAVFANTADNNNMYVAGYATNSVYAISTSTDVVSTTIPVGAHPVALAELPNNQQIYVANQGSGTVSVISTVNDTVTQTIVPATGAVPVWVVAKSDSTTVYVLDNSGVIYDFNPLVGTIRCTGPQPTGCSATATANAGAGSNFLTFDPTLDRLYVTNPTNSEIGILDASVDPPRLINTINLATAAASVCSSCAPDSITALGDGSRAYAAAYQFFPGCTDTSGNAVNCVETLVAVIDGPSATLKSVVPQPSLTITGVSVANSTATYTFVQNTAQIPRAGNNIVITGMSNAVNNGTFVVNAAVSGTFTVSNASAVNATGQSGTGIVVGAALNTTGCGPGSGPPSSVWQPGTARFRVSIASSGGGTNSNFKVYVGQCDLGSVAVINTNAVNGNLADTYSGASLSPPLSTFPPLPGGVPATQNPVFVVAGP
jgi:YVTN family beta-propeller protein